MKKYTNQEKRRLAYQNAPKPDDRSLELPESMRNKVSHIEHKKVKEAFFIESDRDLKLSRSQFIVAVRSLGIVARTVSLYQIFDDNQKPAMDWNSFLKVYVSLRNQKGSYKEVDTAVNLLDKEYNGRWEQLYTDLAQLGDVLSQKQLLIFKQQILQDKLLNNDNLKNVLLGYK